MLPQKWMCREISSSDVIQTGFIEKCVRIYEIRGFFFFYFQSQQIHDIWSHVNQSTFGAGFSIFCFQFIYHYDCLKSKIHIKKLDVIHKRFFCSLLYLNRVFVFNTFCCFWLGHFVVVVGVAVFSSTIILNSWLIFFFDNVYLNKAF